MAFFSPLQARTLFRVIPSWCTLSVGSGPAWKAKAGGTERVKPTLRHGPEPPVAFSTCCKGRGRRLVPQRFGTGVIAPGAAPRWAKGSAGRGHTDRIPAAQARRTEHKMKRFSLARLVCTRRAQGTVLGMTKVQHCRNHHGPAVNLPIFIY